MSGWVDSSVGLDYSELTEFEKRILEISKTKYPKETKKFIQRAANRFGREVKTTLKGRLKYKDGRKTGNLLRGLKRGRAYVYHSDCTEYQCRVMFKRPAYHAWLVEHGHNIMVWHKPKFSKPLSLNRKTEGTHAVADTVKTFKSTFTQLAKEYVDSFLEKGFY